jgi:hypothetical protein
MKTKPPQKILTPRCPVCGGVDGCEPTGGYLGDVSALTADDWRRVYEFMRYVQIPFIHAIIANAILRAKGNKENEP